MDGLSSAASIISVASLAIQLAGSVKKLCEFWGSVKEAPEEIRSITADLRLLSSVLSEIAFESQHVGFDVTMAAVLTNCTVKVKTFSVILEAIKPGLTSGSSRIRNWTSFKAALKSGKIKKLQDALESLKGTLLLAQQTQHGRLNRFRDEIQQQSLLKIMQGIPSLSVEHSSGATKAMLNTLLDPDSHLQIPSEKSRTKEIIRNPVQGFVSENEMQKASREVLDDLSLSTLDENGRVLQEQASLKHITITRRYHSVTEYIFGTVYNRSTKSLIQTTVLEDQIKEDQYEYKSSYIVHPARWLINLGLIYGFCIEFARSPVQGWKSNLNTFCPVPDDALIFEFCTNGNLPAVRSLLSKGYASVRDTDSIGRTALYFAAQDHYPELCKLLIDAGADLCLRNHYEETPLITAARVRSAVKADIPNVIDTLRLFSDCTDFGDSSGDGWKAIVDLFEDRGGISKEPGVRATLVLRVLQLRSADINTNYLEDQYANLGIYAFEKIIDQEVGDFILNVMGRRAINARSDGCGYTPLQLEIAHGGFYIEEVLRWNPDLHLSTVDTELSPNEESPTSLAMYSSWMFSEWRTKLNYLCVDFEDFVEKELDRGPLLKAGWTSETLLGLFQMKHQRGGDFAGLYYCSDCSEELMEINVQPYWLHLLERYKREKDSKILSESVSLRGDKAKQAVSCSLQSQKMMDQDLLADNLPSDDEAGGIEAGVAFIHPALKNVTEDAGDQKHSQPAAQLEYEYRWEDYLCIRCWVDFKRTGIRERSSYKFGESLIHTDDASEHDYSPFLFNT